MPKSRNPKHDRPPTTISGTGLWKRVRKNPEYQNELLKIRKFAAKLGEKIAPALPEYTDHSISHMDALWKIADSVLTASETAKFSPGEAFLLGAAFYLHDLGMAASVTKKGSEEVRSTEHYASALSRIEKLRSVDKTRAEQLALRDATREIHAEKALEFAIKEIPGVNRYLIESSDFRNRWAHILGQIAQSHHWNIAEIERWFGSKQPVPGPDGENIDPGYVACVLRVVDFAHINRERAPNLERSLRPEIPPDSIRHWDAQADITGPARDGDLLVYGCSRPIANIDAWWLFYDMCRELDAETRAVHDYLRARTFSASRFSLAGVKGTENPTVFSQYVRLPQNVVPIDIRVHPDSMERIVELLGGRQIYGLDSLAPIRELIQNARDAIDLSAAAARAEGVPANPGEISVNLASDGRTWILSVADNGVGMTRTVVQKHLVGVGSDYWNSAEFYREFSKVAASDFRPIGKFGIEFLSVFMLGDHIEVETEARASERIKLTLHGIGRRGEVKEEQSTGRRGTEVRITLKAGLHNLLKDLPAVIRARAPMLSIPVKVNYVHEGHQRQSTITPGWWKTATIKELIEFAGKWREIAYDGGEPPPLIKQREAMLRAHYYETPLRDLSGRWSVSGWPGSKPEFVNDSKRLISLGGEAGGGVVVCSQGVAVDLVRVPDSTGLAELGPVNLTVSRNSVVSAEHEPEGLRYSSDRNLASTFIGELRPSVAAKADELHSYGMLPGRIGFLRGLASIYGKELLEAMQLTWIPVTEPPGNVVHQSKAKFISMLTGTDRMLLAVGVASGGAYKMALPYIAQSELAKMLLVAISSDVIDVQYSVKNQLERENSKSVTVGPLREVMSAAHQDESKLVLTTFIISCVAEAWSTTPEALCAQEWYLDFKDDVLWAKLQKPR
jgi:hypothetical protein